MNLKDRLVMVGGIGKQDRPDIIEGIGIKLLQKNEWQDASRMPHRYFQGFGEWDDVFVSSGIDDLLYIQSNGAPTLFVYNMSHKLWRWSKKCPVMKRLWRQSGHFVEPLDLKEATGEGGLHELYRQAAAKENTPEFYID